MIRALKIATTGMMAQQLNIEVISNNVSNINTPAYKARRVEFHDLMYHNAKLMGTSSSSSTVEVLPTGIQVGTGVSVGSIYRTHIQGDFTNTKNTYDLSIFGKGYFVLLTPEGSLAYTRAGNFQISDKRTIVNAKGYTLSPTITIPQNAMKVSINESGVVLAKIDGQVELQNLGQIEIATFPNEAGLEAIGGNAYIPTIASGVATSGVANTDSMGHIMQGYIENSNVDPVKEITNMITAQRAYEINSKVIKTVDEMMQATNNAKA